MRAQFILLLRYAYEVPSEREQFLLHIIFAYNQRDGEYSISRGHYPRGWIE